MHAIPDSGAGCRSPGYDEFDPPSWPSECAPNKEDWIAVNSHYCNSPGREWGNLFWNCADIAIKSCEKPNAWSLPVLPLPFKFVMFATACLCSV